ELALIIVHIFIIRHVKLKKLTSKEKNTNLLDSVMEAFTSLAQVSCEDLCTVLQYQH
ncbi:hypothetical protein ScPMuIL_007283, partial [Solemya velum]